MSFKQEFDTYSETERKYALWRAIQTLKTAKSRIDEPIIKHFAKLSGVSVSLAIIERQIETIIRELEKHGEHPRERKDDK